ncbi:3prime-5prime exonuclease [Popillia japonica]|uniref:3prime-5prime exonuclease n=1 Tax=Popillia japonica TaxID=7064 RepID=A0AAW1LU25_POPJA
MSNANTNKDTLNGIEENVDLDSFTKEGFKSLTGGIRHSNALPVDTDWNFYKLNESFNKITGNEGERLSKLINSILRKYDIDDNVNSRKSIKDKIELIVEANDSILEKISDNIDEINGIKKKNLQPVQFQTVTAELPTISGSWNRINRATFSVTSLGNLPKVNLNSTKSIHLLTGKNIIRPQTFFKDKIDNSNLYPWQPRITEKPNSIRPLAIFLEPTEFGEEFCHPYQTELDQFEPPSHQLQHVTPTKPKPVSETPLHMIETSERLDELVKELLKYPIIAVDLEHHSYRTFLGITCLMQISTIEADYIIDTLVLRDKLYLLNEVFTKPSIIKENVIRVLCIIIINATPMCQAIKQILERRTRNILEERMEKLAD